MKKSEVALNSLTVGSTNLQTSAPQLLAVASDRNEIAFVDIGPSGSRLIILNYQLTDTGYVIANQAYVQSLGIASPSLLIRDGTNGWAYNDLEGNIQTVRPVYERATIEGGTTGSGIPGLLPAGAIPYELYFPPAEERAED